LKRTNSSSSIPRYDVELDGENSVSSFRSKYSGIDKSGDINNTTTNTVRFAVQDSSQGSTREVDYKSMTSDSLDQMANSMMKEEGENNLDFNQQIMYHKKRLKELLSELRYRIGDNKVNECIRSDIIDINTYTWSDLSSRRTSIRILIDIIKHTFAKTVILKDCRFSDLAAKCIAVAVKKNPYIQRLDITFCSSRTRSNADSLSNILNSDEGQYDSTWLLSKLVGPKSASAFADMLQVNKTLRILQLRNASFGDTGVALIAKALQTNAALECLEINNCCTTDYGCQAIAKTLSVNKTLQFISLSQNSLSDRGGIAIVEALENNKTLKALFLRRCALSSPKFCESFGKTLMANQSLIEIDLGSNTFTKDGIKFIAEGLAQNNTLQVLRLEDCNLSRKSASTLSKVLDTQNSLAKVYLGLNIRDKKDLNERIILHNE